MYKVWSDEAWDEYLEWQDKDPDLLKRINKLLRDIERDPFGGIGKPEALKRNLQGWWSRRIDGKNRIVYRVRNNMLEIAQCGSHYGKK
ncbi:MAG: Txe/YoeB family addiction module toxin [Oscillospiraceae bacterium]|nr:Txe/YoeB family addiction module toxin [Oscillospiraceae bacterium]